MIFRPGSLYVGVQEDGRGDAGLCLPPLSKNAGRLLRGLSGVILKSMAVR